MKTPKHLFTAHEIAAAIGRNYTSTIEFLKKHDIKPVREVRTEKMAYRHYSKSAMNQAITIADATLPRRKKKEAPVIVAPVQAELPLDPSFEPKQAERIPNWSEAPTTEPEPAQPKTGLDITIIDTKHAEEMLSTLRSIDEKLGQLLLVWK
jgi:hypothetical protein